MNAPDVDLLIPLAFIASFLLLGGMLGWVVRGIWEGV